MTVIQFFASIPRLDQTGNTQNWPIALWDAGCLVYRVYIPMINIDYSGIRPNASSKTRFLCRTTREAPTNIRLAHNEPCNPRTQRSASQRAELFSLAFFPSRLKFMPNKTNAPVFTLSVTMRQQ